MKYAILLILSCLFTACGAFTHIEPAGKDKLRTDLSLGGPIVVLESAPIFIPYAKIGADYGISDKVDLNASIHITSLFFKLVGFELGADWYPVQNSGYTPEIGLHARSLNFISLKSDVESRARFFPVVSFSSAWKINSTSVYCGSEFVLPVYQQKYTKENKTLVAPFLGASFPIYKEYKLFTELKWAGANLRSDQIPADYVNIGSNGALGIYFSLENKYFQIYNI